MKRRLHYLKAVVICHGKSEMLMCDFMKSNLKIRIDVVADKKGKKSIQITSLKKYFDNAIFKNKECFCAKYGDDLPNGKIPDDFKIFVIMDLDDCTKQQKESFLNKSMFKNHELYNYIVPIFNNPELESVLIKSKISYEKSKGKIEQYIKIFPTDKKYINNDIIQVDEFGKNLKPNENTNMDELVDFVLKIAAE